MKFKYFKQGDIHPASNFRFWQIHHYFTGEISFIVFSLLSFYGLMTSWPMWLVYLFAAGAVISLWVIVDDWLQHFIQAWEIHMSQVDDYEGHYQTVSFWHWIFYKKYWNL